MGLLEKMTLLLQISCTLQERKVTSIPRSKGIKAVWSMLSIIPALTSCYPSNTGGYGLPTSIKRLIELARSIWELECFSNRRSRKPGLWARGSFCVLALSLLGGSLQGAPAARLEARVEYTITSKKDAPPDASNVVIWLMPFSNPLLQQAEETLVQLPHHFRLVQLHKHFDPHLLVVPVGSQVDFPNEDPFFHIVFSLFEGKRFDLGLYEGGATRRVKFDRPGVSYIFCNIHPQMSAVIVTLKTPYYGVTNKLGVVTIPKVPEGQYRLGIWSERALPGTLKSLEREVTIRENIARLARIQIQASGDLLANHKNLYGREYDPVTPSIPYEKPE